MSHSGNDALKCSSTTFQDDQELNHNDEDTNSDTCQGESNVLSNTVNKIYSDEHDERNRTAHLNTLSRTWEMGSFIVEDDVENEQQMPQDSALKCNKSLLLDPNRDLHPDIGVDSAAGNP